MEDRTQEDIIPKFLLDTIPRQNSQDKILTTAAITLIAGCIVLVGAAPTTNFIVAVFLIVSIVALSASFFLLLWYNPRLEMRNEKWKKFLENRLLKFKDEIKDFFNKYEKPLYKQELIKKLEKHKRPSLNRKEWKTVVEHAFSEVEKTSISIADDDVVSELFFKSLMVDINFVHKKIYRAPLKEESYSRFKYYIDMLSWKFRYLFFTVGVVTLILSVITHLLRI